MKLEDLPKFQGATTVDRGDKVLISGRFDRTANVFESRSWLFDATAAWCGDLENLDSNSGTAVFECWDKELPHKLFDDGLFWMHGSYNPNEIWKVLDETVIWLPTEFREVDAIATPSDIGWRQLRPVGQPRSPSEESLPGQYIVELGWDHEHCFICNGRIGIDEPGCFTTPYEENYFWWACPDCFRLWIETHDLGFLYAMKKE